MQKIINIGLIVALLVLGYMQFSRQKGKIVYVENMRLMTNYEGMKVAVEKYKKQAAGWQARVDTLQMEFEQSMKDYEKARATMSQKERQLSEELLQTKQRQFMQYREAMQQKAKEEDGKLSAEVMGVVNTYIKEFGEKKGYKIIIGATQTGNVVYADKAIDVTDEALEWLNKKYKESK